jgi:hypothetical protein
MATVQHERELLADELVDLYASVRWAAYTADPDLLTTGLGEQIPRAPSSTVPSPCPRGIACVA